MNSHSIGNESVVPDSVRNIINREEMNYARDNLIEAWGYAKELGYPNDVVVLIDISPYIYCYFNLTNQLFFHFDQILIERPDHVEVIRAYSHLLFNDDRYEECVELLSRIEKELSLFEYRMLLLSNYYLKNPRVALKLLKDHFEDFVTEGHESLGFILCVGAEIANELLEEELAEEYLGIVKGLESGSSLISIADFIRKANANPDGRLEYITDLYEDYIRLGKPLVIAEHIFINMDLHDLLSATRIIETAKSILSNHELRERDYFRLAQALIIKEEYDEVLVIADGFIDRGNFDPHWYIIKATVFQKMGRIGLAYDEIKESIDRNRFSNEHLKYYVHISLEFGMLVEVEEVLMDLFNSSGERIDKLFFLSNLITIYSSEQDLRQKLLKAVRRFGQLVDREDCNEEGQYLIYSLMSPISDNSEEVEIFKQRLADYLNKFPDSNILRRGAVDLENGPNALLSSMQKIVGITDEQVRLWEQNKNKIRNGGLPVPFVMLDRFLSDTRDLFTTWVLALNTPEDKLEYKLNQAPQLDQIQFDACLSEKKSLLLEDSSLLVLSEAGILGTLLNELDEFHISNSTFERISNSNHPLVGSIYNTLSQKILRVINEHRTKLRLFSDDQGTVFDGIQEELYLKETLNKSQNPR